MRSQILFLVFFSAARLAQAQVDIPVDYYTGKPNINIPLVNLNDRNLHHNITLVYDASGVRVNSTAGWVGTNWQLAGIPEIRRELRGLPDDYYSAAAQKGWLHNSTSSTIGNYPFPADGALLNCGAEETFFSFIDGMNNAVDNENDIFYFSTGSVAGAFMFDNSCSVTSIRTVPYEPIKVIPYRASSISPIDYFEIITADGTIYTYSRKETITRVAEQDSGAKVYMMRDYRQYETAVTFTSAWKLTSIKSAVGERIDFAYTDKLRNSSHGVNAYLPRANINDGFTLSKQYSIRETITLPVIDHISTPHQTVAFNKTDDEVSPDMVRLESILVNEVTPVSSFFVKSIDFAYTYHQTIEATPGAINRIFLREVKVTNACKNQNPYQFSYYGTTQGTVDLPQPESLHQDIWGYYKNVTGTHKVPRIYVYPSLSGINKVTLFQKAGTPGEVIIDGADRLTTTAPTSGVLSDILYPSGAKATLTYGSNEFQNPITNTVTSGAGLRVESIRLHDGITHENDIVKTYEYLDAGGASSGKLLSLPAFWSMSACHYAPGDGYTTYPALSSLPTAEQWRRLVIRTDKNINRYFEANGAVGYAVTTEKISNGKGKTVYTYDIPNTYGSSTSGDWNPTYTLVARNSACPSTGLISPGFYTPPYPDPTPYDFARGVLTKTSHFAEGEANPVKETTYTYADKTISPATIKSLVYEIVPYSQTGYFYLYGVTKTSSNKMKVLSSITESVRDKSNPTAYVNTVTTYVYGSAHPFVASMNVANSDGSQVLQRYKYVRDYTYSSTASSDLQVQMIDKMYERGQYGTLVEQVSSVIPSGGTEKTAQGTLLLFDNFGTVNDPVIMPKQTLTLDGGSGITSFALSTYSGTGASRVFTKNTNYRVSVAAKYKSKGDLIQVENSQRQLQSVHPDNLSGLKTASIADAEPQEVIYSSFDHDTDFDFDFVSFAPLDRDAEGRTGAMGLKGFKPGVNKYLKKTFKKKPGVDYKFAAWYKPPVTTGTHSLRVTIKNISGVQLLQQTLTYSITSLNWHYGEMTLNTSGIADTDVTVEVSFTGSYSAAADQSSIVDDVLFSPAPSEIALSTYNTAYGPTSVTTPDGRITQFEFGQDGRMKYVRDHERNIIQKTSYTEWAETAQGGSPIGITLENTIYDSQQTYFTAVTNCLDIGTLQWKVTPSSNPSGGSFFNGADVQPYTFTSPGNYIATLKITHSSYGTYEYSKTVSVSSLPLTVSACVTGPTNIDICTNTVNGSLSCTTPAPPVDYHYTTFTVTAVSGCPSGATYTYTWATRPYQDTFAGWTAAGTGSSITIANYSTTSYDIKCIVTSSCGRTGESGISSVYMFKSDPNCEYVEN